MAQKIIDEIVKMKSSSILDSPSVLIGIHVRSNGAFRMHLKTLNATPMGLKYYEKAISALRQIYPSPVFLVVSDSKDSAMNKVIRPQKKLSK